jgi:hypothetical protein
VLAFAAFAPWSHAQDESDPRSEGTKRMAALLAKTAAAVDPMQTGYLSAKRVEPLRRRAERRAEPAQKARALVRLARALLDSNRIEESLAALDEAGSRLASEAGVMRDRADFERLIDRLRAICWLRRGELDNCLARHGCDSCILPIRPGGRHVERTGSETAIPLLLKMLEENPEDYEAIWLLNLAHMTFGSWPAEVPERFRIPESALASDAEFPRFTDVARACGVDWTSLSGGASAEDFDGDGLLDLALTGIGFREQMQVFLASGDGTFRNHTRESAVEGICGGLNVIHGDYDNDGDVDLYVLRGAWFGEQGLFPDSLLRNRGDGVFDDVTEEAGVLAFHPSQTAVFTDLDGDVWLDLVVGSETTGDGPLHASLVYVNRRDGRFEEVGSRVGAELNAFVKAVVAGDFDNDGRPDLYYSCRAGRNALLRNEPWDEPPGFRFRDVTEQTGVRKPEMGFPAFFFDYDNDGWLDLYCATNSGFVGEMSDDIGRFHVGLRTEGERPSLYRNLGNGKFRDVARELGADRAIFSKSANFGDLDNDGWLDFHLGTGTPDLAALLPNKLFRNDEGRRFLDVTTASGTGHLQKSHGIAFADFDNDDDQDLFVHLGGGVSGDVYPAALFENPGSPNHWVTLRLRGVQANRFGVGARIEVRAARGQTQRSIHVTCDSGGSFGASSLQQEIGLGDADRIVFVEIRWPGSGTIQRLTNVPIDRFVLIVEGDATVRPLDPPRLRLGGESRRDGAR